MDQSSEFQKARTLFSEADIIAFLGFGFDPINLKRLQLRQRVFKTAQRDDKWRIYGTSFELGEARKACVNEYFYDMITLADRDVYNMIKNEQILLQLPDRGDSNI